MKMLPKSRWLAFTALLLTAVWSAGAAAQDGSFERRIQVGDATVLDVTTGSGSIDVRTGSGSEAVIHGEIRVQRRFFARPRDWEEIVQQVENAPPVEMSGDKLKVGYFSDRGLRKKVSVSYEITIPETMRVVADAGSGSITIVDIAASIEADTGSGSITIENIAGPVSAHSGSGSIKADGVAGEFKGSAGSGRITMTQTAPGDVSVSTGSGNATLNGVVGAVRADAGSGSITVEGVMAGDWRLDTGSGTVRIALPDDAAFELDAETGSGGIDIDHPLTVSGKVSNKHLRGSVRGGGPRLKIETGSGGIRIR